MSKLLNYIFPRPEFLAEPPTKKRKLITDIAIFSLTFLVCSIFVDIITTPAIIVDFISRGMLEVIIKYGTSGEGYVHLTEILMGSISEWVMLVMLLSFIVLTLGTILLRVYIEHGNVKSLGFTKRNFFPPYFLGFAIGLGMVTVVILIEVLTGSASLVGFLDFKSEGSVRELIYVILFLFGYAVQGMAEEVIFRGYLMTAITRKHSTTLAVLVSSAIFASAHIANPGMNALGLFVIFSIGVVLSLITLKTGNILVSCGLHTAWNFALGNVYGENVLNQKYSSVFKLTFTGKVFGVDESWLYLAIILIVFIIFALIKIPNVKYLNQVTITSVDTLVAPLPVSEEQLTSVEAEEQIEKQPEEQPETKAEENSELEEIKIENEEVSEPVQEINNSLEEVKQE